MQQKRTEKWILIGHIVEVLYRHIWKCEKQDDEIKLELLYIYTFTREQCRRSSFRTIRI